MAGAAVEYIPDVDRALQRLLAAVREVLGDQFVGMYLCGSLSSGDFDEASSDVDFVVVTRSELSAEQLTRLARMHADIKDSGLPFTDRLEGSYIPVEAMRRYDPANSKHPSVGVERSFGTNEHGWNWVLERANILRSGHALAGPAPSILIDPIGPEDLKTAVRHVLTGYWAHIGEPDWLRLAAHQAFTILTMCRALHTLNTGELATKPQAGRWAGDSLGEPWRGHIAWALQHRHDFTPHDPTMAHEFIDRVLELTGCR